MNQLGHQRVSYYPKHEIHFFFNVTGVYNGLRLNFERILEIDGTFLISGAIWLSDQRLIGSSDNKKTDYLFSNLTSLNDFTG